MSWLWLLPLAAAIAGAAAIAVATQRLRREQEACVVASESLANVRPALVATRRQQLVVSERREGLWPSP